MPSVPAPEPAVSPIANKGAVIADQGQRAQAAKMKGMQQAIVAGDTGGWNPSSPSLFGNKKTPDLVPGVAATDPFVSTPGYTASQPAAGVPGKKGGPNWAGVALGGGSPTSIKSLLG